jgi:hypothetical protein
MDPADRKSRVNGTVGSDIRMRAEAWQRTNMENIPLARCMASWLGVRVSGCGAVSREAVAFPQLSAVKGD